MEHRVSCEKVNELAEGRPNVGGAIKKNEVAFVINTTHGQQATIDSYEIRRESIMSRSLYSATISGVKALLTALDVENLNKVNKLQDLHFM